MNKVKIKTLTNDFIEFSKELYKENPIPLHRPYLDGNEKKYLVECIDSNYVSSVGEKVSEFEKKICNFTNSKYAVATVNGTSALHTSMLVAGVKEGDEVLTQSLTFIATCNAISYIKASPIFIDIEKDTLGLCPNALKSFLSKNAKIINGKTININSGREIKACIPMHTFGLPLRINEINDICEEWGIVVIEDAAESLGSFYNKKHTGTFGKCGVLSFNGNKIITTGGGGMLITNDYDFAKKAKHITTTAKVPHEFEFVHDMVGYNYRMPNINAALGCAQMENIENFIDFKRILHKKWIDFFKIYNINVVSEINLGKSNYWLNAILFDSESDRDYFLKITNKNNVMTRPVWRLMSRLPMFSKFQKDNLINSTLIEKRLVNIPSSVTSSWINEQNL